MVCSSLLILGMVTLVLGTNSGDDGLGLTFGDVDQNALAREWPVQDTDSAKGDDSVSDVASVDVKDTSAQSSMRFARRQGALELASSDTNNNVRKFDAVSKAVLANNSLHSVHSGLVGKMKQVRNVLNKTRKTNGYSAPAKNFMWNKLKTRGTVPPKREGHSAAVVEDLIVVFGGCYLDKRCFNDLNIFNTRTHSWVRPKVDGLPPVEREGHTATMVGPLMYVYGGSSEVGYLDDVYVLNTHPAMPNSGEELSMAWGHVDVEGVPPLGREGHSAVRFGTHIIIFGGYTEKGFSDELIVLDTALSAWQRPAVTGPKPSAREGHTAFIFNNRMYVFGGFMNGGCLNDLYVLDLKTFAWEVGTATGTPPSRREDMGAIVRGNELLVTGGCNFGKRKCFCDLHVLNLGNMQWREEKVSGADDKTMTPREDHSVSMVHGRAYVFGGCLLAQQCYNDMLTLEPQKGSLVCGGNDCSGHGVCRTYKSKSANKDVASKIHSCACDPGFTGEDCSEKTRCPSDCSGHGFCKNNFQCACTDGWTLKDCSLRVTCPGVYRDKKTLTKPELKNLLHYDFTQDEITALDGDATSLLDTGGNKNSSTKGKVFLQCAGHGSCREDGHCECIEGYYGTNCNLNRVCPNECSGHGVCAGTPKADAVKRALTMLAAEASTGADPEKIADLPPASIEPSLLEKSEAGGSGKTKVAWDPKELSKQVDLKEAPLHVYCHCDEGFSDIDCSRPCENIIPINFTMSLSVEKMTRSRTVMALTSGWASALAVATANFLGVRSEHVHIQVLPEGKSRMSLLELNGKKRLASQADNMLRAAGAPDKLSSQPLGSVVLFIAVECRGAAQTTAVEDQLLLPRATRVMEIFFKKQLPPTSPDASLTLISTSFKKKVPSMRKQQSYKKKRKNNRRRSTPTFKTSRSSVLSSVTSAVSSMFSASKQSAEPQAVAPPHAVCPSKCSSHGICRSGVCYCHQGFQGNACGITVKKEFVSAEAQLLSQGITKWAAGSFVVGLAMVAALHPLYLKIKEERKRVQMTSNGPMIDMQRRYYK